MQSSNHADGHSISSPIVHNSRIACERCRHHKLRCTRRSSLATNDTCIRCSRTGAQCTTKSKGRVGRPKTKQAHSEATDFGLSRHTTSGTEDEQQALDDVALELYLSGLSATPNTDGPHPPTQETESIQASGSTITESVCSNTTPSSESIIGSTATLQSSVYVFPGSQDNMEGLDLTCNLSDRSQRRRSEDRDLAFIESYTDQGALEFDIEATQSENTVSQAQDSWMQLSLLGQQAHQTWQSLQSNYGSDLISRKMNTTEVGQILRVTQDICDALQIVQRQFSIPTSRSANQSESPDTGLIMQISHCHLYVLRIHIILISKLLDEMNKGQIGKQAVCDSLSFQIGAFDLGNSALKAYFLVEIAFQLIVKIEAAIGIPNDFCVGEVVRRDLQSILGQSSHELDLVGIIVSSLIAEEKYVQNRGGAKRLKELYQRARKRFGHNIVDGGRW